MYIFTSTSRPDLHQIISSRKSWEFSQHFCANHFSFRPRTHQPFSWHVSSLATRATCARVLITHFYPVWTSLIQALSRPFQVSFSQFFLKFLSAHFSPSKVPSKPIFLFTGLLVQTPLTRWLLTKNKKNVSHLLQRQYYCLSYR